MTCEDKKYIHSPRRQVFHLLILLSLHLQHATDVKFDVFVVESSDIGGILPKKLKSATHPLLLHDVSVLKWCRTACVELRRKKK